MPDSGTATAASTATASTGLPSRGVHHLALTTEDMQMTTDFFVNVVGMPLVHAMKVPPGVGVGPGDPELLTLRAMAFVRRADVIVYDRLVGAAIFNFAPANCRRIDAGKRKGGAEMTQTAINALLVRQARLGHAVVPLKGGDPFILAVAAKNSTI